MLIRLVCMTLKNIKKDLPKFEQSQLILIWLLSSGNPDTPEQWVYECEGELASGDASRKQREPREAK
jgi:hypothetical protein